MGEPDPAVAQIEPGEIGPGGDCFNDLEELSERVWAEVGHDG